MFGKNFNSYRWAYFYRLASEAGYGNFLFRYMIRVFHKVTKTSHKIKLFNNVEMILPYDSKFATEIFIKRNKLDWGSEIIFHQFFDSEKDFIDVGANIGYYTLLAAPLSNQVYAFEPDPRVIVTLEKNISQFQNCQIVKEALYSESGNMELTLYSDPEFNSLTRQSFQANSLTVKVNTLDNLMSDHPSLNVSGIKIDAEGADFEILLGGKNFLTRYQPLVLCEAYPNVKLLKFAKLIGFTCFAFVKPKDKSLFHLSPKFIKIESVPNRFRVKMIFLVPNRLLARFEELADSFDSTAP